MRYEGMVYRPPSEAQSLLIQVTMGCSHNECTFCGMFKDTKFKIRKIEDVYEDLIEAREYYKEVKRVFLIDGDALVLKTDHLEQILLKIKEIFPECERVGLSSTTMDISRKSDEDLTRLRDHGLKIIYLGVETGSDTLLKEIKKGVTSSQIIEAGKRVRKLGIKLSVSLISGLGGKENWQEHAIETARVISAINPDYIGFLTLVLEKNTELYEKVQKGEMTVLSPEEVMLEMKVLVQNLELTDSLFRGNHASNYIPLAGTLNKDKDKILDQLDYLLVGNHLFKSDDYRSV